ncbi:hypothetical protein GA0115233_10342 [Streptomyces sp. DI166]|nr:hypothetical protein GA0115233_10342 [Streptomyces sp. DI166]
MLPSSSLTSSGKTPVGEGAEPQVPALVRHGVPGGVFGAGPFHGAVPADVRPDLQDLEGVQVEHQHLAVVAAGDEHPVLPDADAARAARGGFLAGPQPGPVAHRRRVEAVDQLQGVQGPAEHRAHPVLADHPAVRDGQPVQRAALPDEGRGGHRAQFPVESVNSAEGVRGEQAATVQGENSDETVRGGHDVLSRSFSDGVLLRNCSATCSGWHPRGPDRRRHRRHRHRHRRFPRRCRCRRHRRHRRRRSRRGSWRRRSSGRHRSRRRG